MQEKFRELRAKTGLSQAKFAELTGISKRVIENWEGGQRTPPPYIYNLLEYFVNHEILQ